MKRIIVIFALFTIGVSMSGCGSVDESAFSSQSNNYSNNINADDKSYDSTVEIDTDYKIAEVPEIPDELKGKNIICNQTEPDYDQIMNLENICNEYIDTLITVKINSYDYTWLKNTSGGGSSWTIIDATVTDSMNSKLDIGTNLRIYTYGGYVSMREKLSDILYKTGGKYGDGIDMTEDEIDNTVYYDIVDGGKLPIINQEYAVCLKKARDIMVNGDYELIGGVNGILLKTNGDYLYMSSEYDDVGNPVIEKYSRDDLLKLFPNK